MPDHPVTPDDPYRRLVARSERVSWTVDQVLGAAPALDFERPFLPEPMTHASEMTFLSPAERLAVSQLRGHGYARISSVFEEGILPFVWIQLRERPAGASDQVRALLRFADEEAKHIQLFHRYAESFETQAGVAPPIAFSRELAIATTERSHPLAVALMSAHIEWMTQTHYVQAVKDDAGLDATSLRVLSYHYVEEVQHARIDELLIDAIAERCSDDEVVAAIEAYRQQCAAIDALLERQAELDADSLGAMTGRPLGGDERTRFVAIQHRATRETFLGARETHPRVRGAIERLSASVAAA